MRLDPSSLVGVVIGLVLGGLAGSLLGRRLEGRRAWFWTAEAACVLLGVAVIYAGQMAGLGGVSGGGLGLIAGGVNGLKYGADAVGVHAGPGPEEADDDSDTPEEHR